MSNKFNIKKCLVAASLFFFMISAIPAKAYEPEAVKNYNLGIDASKEGNFTDATTYFRRAIFIDPSFTDAYFNLGSIYEYKGDTLKAVEAYKDLLKRTPEDGEVAYKIANIYYKRHEYSKALGYIYLISSDSPKYNESQVLYKSIMKSLNTPTVKPTTAPIKKSPPQRITIKGFKGPTGITKDSKNNIYIANYSSNSITKITPAGVKSILTTGKSLNGPIGLTVDKADNIYCANYVSGQVVKISPTGTVSVLAKGISKPYYLYLDKNNLYVSEQGTNSVVIINLGE